MPESYSGEHLSRAEVILAGSGSEILQERIKLAIYGLSNNFHDVYERRRWEDVVAVLEEIGIMQIPFNFNAFDDTTISAFMEKLFQGTLHRACEHDDEKPQQVLKWLLSSGQSCNVGMKNSMYAKSGMAPLQKAAWAGRPDLVKLLLDYGADLNWTVSGEACRVPPLYYATAVGKLELVHILAEHGAYQVPALYYAVAAGNFEVAQILAEHGADLLHTYKPTGVTFVDMVSICGQSAGFRKKDSSARLHSVDLIKNVLQLLLSRYKLESPASFITPDVFIAAASAGNDDVIQFLYSISKNISAGNGSGITPLHAAARYGRISTCHLLLQLGAQVNTSHQYPSPLHVASNYGQEDAVRLLLANGAEANP